MGSDPSRGAEALGQPQSPHVSEAKVGFVAVSSVVVKHQPCCMKRAERQSPPESSAKNQANFEQPCYSWEQNLHKSSWNKTRSATQSWMLDRQLGTEEIPSLSNRQ